MYYYQCHLANYYQYYYQYSLSESLSLDTPIRRLVVGPGQTARHAQTAHDACRAFAPARLTDYEKASPAGSRTN